MKKKSLTKPEAIAGVAYYNTFTPSVSANQCDVNGGTSSIYAVDLALGINIYSKTRIIEHANTIQDELTIIVGQKIPARIIGSR